MRIPHQLQIHKNSPFGIITIKAMAKQVHVFILFTILFFARKSLFYSVHHSLLRLHTFFKNLHHNFWANKTYFWYDFAIVEEISAQAATGECVPKTETFLTGCTQDSTCVRTCQLSHYDTGKCITSNFHCICFKECHKMEDVHRD